METEVSHFGDLTVVELGQYIAVPYCAELLAHSGADVISVEPVDGGPTRHNSVVSAGITASEIPGGKLHGHHYFTVEDPDGHVITLYTSHEF